MKQDEHKLSAGLTHLLWSVSWLTMITETGRTLFLGGVVLLTAGMTALILDALLALPVAALIVVDLLAVGLLLVAAWLVVRVARANRHDPRRAARLIEQRLNLTDNRVINAVDLALSSRPSGSAQLTEQAVATGEALGDEVSAGSAVSAKPLMTSAGILAASLLVALMAFLAAPRVFAMVLPRYLDPTGDHPPYTLLNFNVAVNPEAVYLGRPATITAEISGLDSVEAANLVFLDGDARNAVPLFRGNDGDFHLSIENAEETREFYVDTPRGRSKRFTFRVLQVPFIESAEATYSFPTHTEWPEVSQPLDARGIRAIVGTKVRVAASSNLELKSGLLEIFSEDGSEQPTSQIKMRPVAGQPKSVAGSFTLQENGRYRLSLTGINDAPSHETLAGRIVAVADAAPRLRIVQPEPRVVAVEKWKIPVTIHATDDVAVQGIELFCGVNGWGPHPVQVKTEWTRRGLAQAQYEFDLAALGAAPGDVISYYASARDNHPGQPR
ncbi:MAG: hypothetical protein N2C14_03135, partial [Planctomycetales bacterium]